MAFQTHAVIRFDEDKLGGIAPLRAPFPFFMLPKVRLAVTHTHTHSKSPSHPSCRRDGLRLQIYPVTMAESTADMPHPRCDLPLSPSWHYPPLEWLQWFNLP